MGALGWVLLLVSAGCGVQKGRSASGGGPNGDKSNGPCQGLACQQVSCEAGSTVISGAVFTPNGSLPLYDVIVYVPNGPVAPFPAGVSCDVCGTLKEAKPLVSTLTGADGKFKLFNVPAGDNIPVVAQIGRWRKQVVIPHVEACRETALPDPQMLYMPSNQSQGDIPQIAVATGDLDPLECLLRKIGIDDAEFTDSSHSGRVHIYMQNGQDLSPPSWPASMLWSSLDQLKKYDMVLLPCEGEPALKPGGATQNMIDYASAGGRVFATHYSYVWIANAQQPFPQVAQWTLDQMAPNGIYYDTLVDTTFPKGMAFSQWLENVGASPKGPGMITIEQVRRDVDAVNNPPAQRWIYAQNPDMIQHFTFNTPVGAAQQCGRVVYSDFHVTVNAKDSPYILPTSCKLGPLTPNEKALAFMLFDLSSCVQDDSQAPAPPK